MKGMTLNEYFETEFSDLVGAKKWYKKWSDDWDQNIPGLTEYSGKQRLGLRTMATFISCYLTGDELTDNVAMTSTEHGCDIYFCACEDVLEDRK